MINNQLIFLNLLENLVIKNIVLIDEANIDFSNNLCVLTGETGSGKSILLDALSLAIGVRSSSRLLRNGEKQGSVIATFNISTNKKCMDLLRSLDIENDGELVLRRILTQDGKSKAYINNVLVGQGFLNNIGEELIEIHGQHDQRGLLNSSFHRDILDEYGNLNIQKKTVSDLYNIMKDTENKFINLTNEKENIEKEIDYLQSIYDEIDKMNIQDNEEEELNNKRILLMNKEKVISVLQNVKNTIDGQNSIVKIISNLQNSLSRSSGLGENILEEGKNAFEDIIDSFERGIIELNDGINIIDLIFNNLDFNEDTLDTVEERLFNIRGLARKFNVPCNCINDFKMEINIKLEKLQNQTVEMGNLKDKLIELKKQYFSEALKLRDQRKNVAENLKNELIQELIPLKMENTRFRAEFLELNESNWNPSGIDNVRFIVAMNTGTELDELSKVASGGELSRFMLALKVVLSKVKSVPTIIFDEIDTGISGAVADAVGERLKKLGQNSQVIVITHLPQVASKGDNHLKISKQTKNDKTYTIIEKLDNQTRKIEIAKMISGENITDEAINMANKLLGN